MLSQVACHLKYAIFVLVGIVVVILLSKWTGKRCVQPATSSGGVVERVMVNSAHANEASYNPSQHPANALIEATTALVSLNTAAEYSGDAEVARVAGASVDTLRREMMARQQELMAQLVSDPPAQLQPLPAPPK